MEPMYASGSIMQHRTRPGVSRHAVDNIVAADQNVSVVLIEKVQRNNLEDVYMYYFGENSINPGNF